MEITRRQIVEEARTWLGTPFAHQGRQKGAPGGDPYVVGGCDCVGIILCIAEKFELLDKNGEPFLARQHLDYPDQPMSNRVQRECEHRLIAKPIDTLREGDIVTLKMPSITSHAAIVSTLYEGTRDECFGIIHSFAPAGKVIETILDKKTFRHIVGVFRFSGIVDG